MWEVDTTLVWTTLFWTTQPCSFKNMATLSALYHNLCRDVPAGLSIRLRNDNSDIVWIQLIICHFDLDASCYYLLISFFTGIIHFYCRFSGHHCLMRDQLDAISNRPLELS